MEFGLFIQNYVPNHRREHDPDAEHHAIFEDLEAVIAAIHLDGQMSPARAFVRKLVLSELEDLDDESFETSNSKSALQEWTQSLGLPFPRYATVETSGPEHAKLFTVEVRVGDQLTTRATARSKKAASQEAAQRLIDQLKSAELTEPRP